MAVSIPAFGRTIRAGFLEHQPQIEGTSGRSDLVKNISSPVGAVHEQPSIMRMKRLLLLASRSDLPICRLDPRCEAQWRPEPPVVRPPRTDFAPGERAHQGSGGNHGSRTGACNIRVITHTYTTTRPCDGSDLHRAHVRAVGSHRQSPRSITRKVPSGTIENSPAIHRWANNQQTRTSPGGAKETMQCVNMFFRPWRDLSPPAPEPQR